MTSKDALIPQTFSDLEKEHLQLMYGDGSGKVPQDVIEMPKLKRDNWLNEVFVNAFANARRRRIRESKFVNCVEHRIKIEETLNRILVVGGERQVEPAARFANDLFDYFKQFPKYMPLVECFEVARRVLISGEQLPEVNRESVVVLVTKGHIR